MTARVAAAEHLGALLSDGPPIEAVPDHRPLADRMTRWRTEWALSRFTDPVAKGGDPSPLTDFQTGFYDMARRLREAGLPGAHP